MGMAKNNQSLQLRASGVQLAPGQSIVSTTDNPLVARYTYAPPVAGDVSIQFGLDTTYGQQTVDADRSRGCSRKFPGGRDAGELAPITCKRWWRPSGGSTDRRRRSDVSPPASFPADRLPSLTVTTQRYAATGCRVHEPGDRRTMATYLQAYAVDLSGNVIWGYDYPDRRGR